MFKMESLFKWSNMLELMAYDACSALYAITMVLHLPQSIVQSLDNNI